MKVTRLEMPDGLLVKIEGGTERDVNAYINNRYQQRHEAAQRQYQTEMTRNARPIGTPGHVPAQGEGEVLVPIPVMNFSDDHATLARHVKKQHAPEPVSNFEGDTPMPLPEPQGEFDDDALPIPQLNFAAPGKSSASPLVANEQDALPVPAMTF